MAPGVAALVARVNGPAGLAGSAGGTVLVAIDGAGGSGKTTFARRIAGSVSSCVVVHGDDFYRPMDDRVRLLLDSEGGYRQYFDWQRLEAEVLRPLRAGRSATYRRYDWAMGELGEVATVPVGGTVLIEGVYALRPELERYYDLTVYVDTPRPICLRRLHDRGHDSGGWIERWRAAEDYYIDRFRPGERADVVVPGA